MNDNKGLRFWKWAVILLVLCNLCLLGVIWMKPGQLFGGQHGGAPRDFVIHTLKFSDEQVKRYDSLITDHRRAMDQVRDEMTINRKQLFENLVKEGKFNPEADSLSRAIGDEQRQIETITYYHFAQVKAICTDAQKAEFDKIIVEVTKMMNGNGRGGRPPHGPGGPPERREDGNPPPPPPRDRPGPPENE